MLGRGLFGIHYTYTIYCIILFYILHILCILMTFTYTSVTLRLCLCVIIIYLFISNYAWLYIHSSQLYMVCFLKCLPPWSSPWDFPIILLHPAFEGSFEHSNTFSNPLIVITKAYNNESSISRVIAIVAIKLVCKCQQSRFNKKKMLNSTSFSLLFDKKKQPRVLVALLF